MPGWTQEDVGRAIGYRGHAEGETYLLRIVTVLEGGHNHIWLQPLPVIPEKHNSYMADIRREQQRGTIAELEGGGDWCYVDSPDELMPDGKLAHFLTRPEPNVRGH